MGESRRPLRPVTPDGMEILFFYACPFCGRHISLANPTQPAMAQCDACGKMFPIVPVDERSIQYIHIITAGGRAAVDPDFA